jgi:hypothetical protein
MGFWGFYHDRNVGVNLPWPLEGNIPHLSYNEKFEGKVTN